MSSPSSADLAKQCSGWRRNLVICQHQQMIIFQPLKCDVPKTQLSENRNLLAPSTSFFFLQRLWYAYTRRKGRWVKIHIRLTICSKIFSACKFWWNQRQFGQIWQQLLNFVGIFFSACFRFWCTNERNLHALSLGQNFEIGPLVDIPYSATFHK